MNDAKQINKDGVFVFLSLLDFSNASLLEHDLALRIEFEERKLSLSV